MGLSELVTRCFDHGGHSFGGGALLPGQEITWSDLEIDSIRTWFPTRELLADRSAGHSALPGVGAGNGFSWNHYGRDTSMEIHHNIRRIQLQYVYAQIVIRTVLLWLLK